MQSKVGVEATPMLFGTADEPKTSPTGGASRDNQTFLSPQSTNHNSNQPSTSSGQGGSRLGPKKKKKKKKKKSINS